MKYAQQNALWLKGVQIHHNLLKENKQNLQKVCCNLYKMLVSSLLMMKLVLVDGVFHTLPSAHRGSQRRELPTAWKPTQEALLQLCQSFGPGGLGDSRFLQGAGEAQTAGKDSGAAQI